MIKSCKVKRTGNIGFRLEDNGPIVTIPVDAPVGARIAVDTDMVIEAGEPFTSVGSDGITRTYVRGEAEAGALTYEKLAAVAGQPPKHAVTSVPRPSQTADADI